MSLLLHEYCDDVPAAALLQGGAAAHQERLDQAQLEEGAARLVVALRQVLAAGATALRAAVAAPAVPSIIKTHMNTTQRSAVAISSLQAAAAGRTLPAVRLWVHGGLGTGQLGFTTAVVRCAAQARGRCCITISSQRAHRTAQPTRSPALLNKRF
jgi:hypothetical protein